MKCKPNCAPGGTLSKTRLASCSGGILAPSTDEYWRHPLTNTGEPLRLHTGRILGRIHRQGILSGKLGGATLEYSAGYSAGSSHAALVDTWRDPLAGYSGRILLCSGAGSTREPLWRDTRRDPLASYYYSGALSGILGGIHWRAALAGYSAGSTGEALAGYSAGFTGEPLWQDTRRDSLASSSGGILGGIHWQAALAGYLAESTGELLWRDTGWGRGVEASHSNITSKNPFLFGGENSFCVAFCGSKRGPII